MEKYEQPGERLVSKVPNEAYKDNYDAIFGKKESWLDRRERERGFCKPPRCKTGSNCYVTCPECQEDVSAEMQEKKKHDDCTD